MSKKPSEEVPSSLPIKGNDHPVPLRPSKLPFRCSTSTPKVSKVPVRTTTSLPRPQVPTKRSYIPMPIGSKAAKTVSNRSIPIANNSSIIKKPLRPSPSPTSSITVSDKNNIQCPRSTIETIESNDPSLSSESSIEEQQTMNKLLPLVQDEGYSTWSSIDVKDDTSRNIGLIQTWLDITDRQSSKTPVKEGMKLIFVILTNVTDAFDNIVFHSMCQY